MKFVSRKELLFSFSFSWKRFPLSREFPFSKSRHENRIKREYDTREMVLDPPKKDGSSKFLAWTHGGRRERNGRVASFLPDDARDTRVALFRWRVPPRVISVCDESRGFTQSRDEKTRIPCSWKFLNDWREFYLFKMKQKTKINERKEPLQLISLYMKIPKRVKTG